MTKPLRALIEVVSQELQDTKTVVEVGSRQAINQEDIANLRNLFPNSKYIGVDMEKGPGVDMVQKGEELPFKNSSQELLICLETFEHCEKFWEVAKEIDRVVKKDGIIIVSSQQNFPIHLHPSDYFRFTPMGMKSLFKDFGSKLVVSISPPFDNEAKLNPQHVIFIGSKKENKKLFNRLKKRIKENVSLISVHKPYRHRLEDFFRYLKRGLNEFVFRQEVEFF